MSSFLARDSVHRDEIKMIHTHKHSAAYRELPPTQINEMSFSHSWVLIWMREVKSLPLAVTSFLSSRWHQPCSRLSLALAWRKWHLSLGRNLPQAKTLRHPQADLQDLTQREPWWFRLEELGMRTGQITHLGRDLPDPSHSPLPLWAVLMQKKKTQPTSHWGLGEHISLYVSPNGPRSTSWQHAIEQVQPSREWKAVLQGLLNLSTLHWSKRIPLCLGISYSKESKTICNNSKRSLIPMELGWDLLLFPDSHCVYINAAFLR